MNEQMGERLPIVYVEWEDSNGLAHWNSKRDMEEYAESDGVMNCRSAGFLLKRGKDRIVLVQSESPSSYGDGMIIPKSAIRKLIYLEAE